MNRTAVAPTLTPLSITTPMWTTPSGSPGSSRSPCPRPRPAPPYPQLEATPASRSPRTRTATAPWSASTGPSWWWTTRPGPGLLSRASPPSSRAGGGGGVSSCDRLDFSQSAVNSKAVFKFAIISVQYYHCLPITTYLLTNVTTRPGWERTLPASVCWS